jgi:hypothetical protein
MCVFNFFHPHSSVVAMELSFPNSVERFELSSVIMEIICLSEAGIDMRLRDGDVDSAPQLSRGWKMIGIEGAAAKYPTHSQYCETK